MDSIKAKQSKKKKKENRHSSHEKRMFWCRLLFFIMTPINYFVCYLHYTNHQCLFAWVLLALIYGDDDDRHVCFVCLFVCVISVHLVAVAITKNKRQNTNVGISFFFLFVGDICCQTLFGFISRRLLCNV